MASPASATVMPLPPAPPRAVLPVVEPLPVLPVPVDEAVPPLVLLLDEPVPEVPMMMLPLPPTLFEPEPVEPEPVAPDAVVLLPLKLSDFELLQPSRRTNPTADQVHALNLIMTITLPPKDT